jgi:hypothetical protein
MYGQLPFPPKIQVPSAIASQNWPRLLINDFVIVAGAINGCKAGTWQDQNSYIGQLPFPGVYEPLLNLLQTHLSFSKDKKIALAPSTRNSPTSIKMHFLAPILATFTTLTTLVSASGFTDPAWSMVTRNQSALFGYQLLGSQFFNTSAVCNNISIASHGLWNGQIDDTYVERMAPCVFPLDRCRADSFLTGAFCDQVSSNQSDWFDQHDLIMQNIRFFGTGTFLGQLMYAFDLSRYRKFNQPGNPIGPDTTEPPSHITEKIKRTQVLPELTTHPTQQTSPSPPQPSFPQPPTRTSAPSSSPPTSKPSTSTARASAPPSAPQLSQTSPPRHHQQSTPPPC